jgi:hypothetical protein
VRQETLKNDADELFTFLTEALRRPRVDGSTPPVAVAHIRLLRTYLSCSVLKPAFSIVFWISACVTWVSS